ncbi:MAG: glycosyltransferase [Opitutaceae bacterium]
MPFYSYSTAFPALNIVVLQDRLRSGGTERQSVLLADAFTAKGHPATLLTFRPGGALAATLAHAGQISLQRFDTGLDWFAPGLSKTLRQLKPKVILCMGRMANCHAGSIQKRFPECAVIATMRTGKPLPWAFRRSLSKVRHIIANSQQARSALTERYGVADDRITVINNSVVFRPDPRAASGPATRADHGVGSQTVVLLCVAMFRPEKNQRELIEIMDGFSSDDDIQLWLAGDGPTLSECEILVEERGLQNRVRFLGWLPDPSAAYAAADIAVHASWSEALSNFIIEAQAHGLPAVVYDAQGNSECMIPGKTGFIIPPGDRKQFRATILEMAREDKETRARRSALASSFARTSFDHSRQVTAYLNLFRSLGAH